MPYAWRRVLAKHHQTINNLVLHSCFWALLRYSVNPQLKISAIRSHKGPSRLSPSILAFDFYRDWVQHYHTSLTLAGFRILALSRFLQRSTGVQACTQAVAIYVIIDKYFCWRIQPTLFSSGRLFLPCGRGWDSNQLLRGRLKTNPFFCMQVYKQIVLPYHNSAELFFLFLRVHIVYGSLETARSVNQSSN